jgi:o-succinylbenzoate synthase
LSKISFNIKPFTLSLKTPIITSKHKIIERKGFLIQVTAAEYFGEGECTPLPEFGSESFEEAEAQINNIAIDSSIFESKDFLDNLDKELQNYQQFPALCHAVEQSILTLYAHIHRVKYADIFNLPSKDEVKVNAFIGIKNVKDTLTDIGLYYNEGFDTIKLKFGRADFQEELCILDEISQSLGNHFNIRLDINGAWDIKTAIERIYQLQKYNIEYIEQPVRTLEQLHEISAISKIAVAADESMRSCEEANIIIDKGICRVLILKPMMLGGIINTLKIAKEAYKKNIKTIISSSFEGPLAFNYAVHAASLINGNYAHGLGIGNVFNEPENSLRYQLRNGKIIVGIQ